jgi:hypothetical protein
MGGNASTDVNMKKFQIFGRKLMNVKIDSAIG